MVLAARLAADGASGGTTPARHRLRRAQMRGQMRGFLVETLNPCGAEGADDAALRRVAPSTRATAAHRRLPRFHRRENAPSMPVYAAICHLLGPKSPFSLGLA